VRVRRGPAAVNGDESHESHWSAVPGWEGVVSRVIRKSENLPEHTGFLYWDSYPGGTWDFPERKKRIKSSWVQSLKTCPYGRSSGTFFLRIQEGL
jgi:hypothetical protein